MSFEGGLACKLTGMVQRLQYYVANAWHLGCARVQLSLPVIDSWREVGNLAQN